MAITVYPPRDFALDGQRCRVHIYDVVTGTDRVVFETDEVLLEAPNWAPEGLLLNGAGLLWLLDPDATGEDVVEVPFTGIPPINNDLPALRRRTIDPISLLSRIPIDLHTP